MGTLRGETLFLADGHVDLPYYMMRHAVNITLSALREGPFTVRKAMECGLRLFCTSLYCEDRFNGEEAFAHFQEILNFTVERFDRVTIVRKKEDLLALDRAGSMASVLLLENADALAANPGHVGKLKSWGIHTVGLTHGGRNRLADGNSVSVSGGLTRKGKEVVRALQDHGLVIDVAHLHPTCFWELLGMFNGKLVTSHTGIREIRDIQRNIDINQAREIILRGGVVGITVNPEMLAADSKAGSQEVFSHLDCLVQRFGPEGVGIGSDFCGFDLLSRDMNDVTGLVLVSRLMKKHGYGEDAVQKIMGLNWLRFYETAV